MNVRIQIFVIFLQPSKGLANFFDSVEIRKDPYGVVLVMGAWNYPVQLSLLPMIGAMAAGNCVILKPSEVAATTAKYLYETIPKYLDMVCRYICCFIQNTQFVNIKEILIEKLSCNKNICSFYF